MDKQIIQEAIKTLKNFGYIVERKGDFYEPSSRPEFYDPDYGKKEIEYSYDEDEYSKKCQNDKATVENYIDENYPNLSVDVSCDYDLDYEKVKYTLDIAFKFENPPTLEECDTCDIISESCAELDSEVPWDDGSWNVIAYDSNGKKIEDVTKYFGSHAKETLPDDFKADYYVIHEYWIGSEIVPEYEPDDPREEYPDW